MLKIAILINLLILSCSTTKPVDMDNNDMVEINFHPIICQGVGPQWCYQIKQNGEKDWTYFYDQIEGLKYEWGFNYLIKVKKEKIENPPADGSSIKWILTSLVKKEKVKIGTSFNLVAGRELTKVDIKNNKIAILEKTFKIANNLKINQLGPVFDLKIELQPSGEFEIVGIN